MVSFFKKEREVFFFLLEEENLKKKEFFLFSSLENNTGTVLSVPLCSTLMSVTVWVLLSVLDRGVGSWVGSGGPSH